MRGSLIVWQRAANERPTRKIKASDVNIVIKSSFVRRKADASCDYGYHRSHQLNKRFGAETFFAYNLEKVSASGETFIPLFLARSIIAHLDEDVKTGFLRLHQKAGH